MKANEDLDCTQYSKYSKKSSDIENRALISNNSSLIFHGRETSRFSNQSHFDRMMCNRAAIDPDEIALKKIMEINKQSMSMLKNNKPAICYKLLQTACQLLDEYSSLNTVNALADSKEYFNAASVTYNNLGCYYQKKDDFKNSLKYLEMALDYNKHIDNDEINKSSTHLNICALYSQTGDHDKAYQHSKMALKLLPPAHRKMKQLLLDNGISDTNSMTRSDLSNFTIDK